MAKAKFSPKASTQWTNMNSSIKYLLIFALVILLGFTLVYIYNIQRMTSLEKFATTIEEEHSNGGSMMQVMYMYSENCPYCQDFSPVFEEYKRSANLPNVAFKAIEKSDPFAAKYMSQITGFPTVLVVDQAGSVIGSQVGSTSIEDLRSFVETYSRKMI